MSLNLQKKKLIVSEIKEISKVALSAVIVDFRGMSANKINELRKIGRELDVCIRVVRNTLLLRAIKDTTFECLKKSLVGSIFIAYSMKNPSTAARLFKDFEKKNVKFEIKAAAFEGRYIPASQINYLATFPTHQEAIIRLIETIKESTIGRLIRILVIIKNMKKEVI